MLIAEETYLEHYGVKGMRWGVRNDRRSQLTPYERQQKIHKRNRRIITAVRLALIASFLAPMFKPNGSAKTLRVSQRGGKVAFRIPAPPPPKYPNTPKFTIHPDAKKILMAQERQRNGAYQVRQMLKQMGADVVEPRG